MALFSKKKKIIVSSSTYNLAGDINNRVKFLPTTVMGYILRNDSSASLGNTIVSSLLSGPGIQFRSFGRWSRSSGYTDFLGQTSGGVLVAKGLDLDTLALNIPHSPGQTVIIQTADVGPADYGYWCDQWMLENHPTEVNDDYVIDFNEVVNTVYITFKDGRQYTFNPQNFDVYSEYLYVSYLLRREDQLGPISGETEIIVPSYNDIPPVDGWTNFENKETPVTRNIGTGYRDRSAEKTRWYYPAMHWNHFSGCSPSPLSARKVKMSKNCVRS